MNTRFIGIKEFRQNISKFAKKAQHAKEKYIIVNRTKPLFELSPFKRDETMESLFNDILSAKKDIAKGKIYTHEEILAELE